LTKSSFVRSRAKPRASTRNLALIALLLGACGPKPTTSPPSAAVQESLRPPSALGYDFMWRQRVIAEWPTGKQEFEAVLQKRNGELTLLGLSPMGLPGFVLTLHENGSITVENRMDRELPFEPAYILADVQRVFFPWLAAVEPAFEGERQGSVGAQQITERYAAGRLVSRDFRRAETPDQAVHIEYGATPAGGDAAAHVALDNGLHRYRLVIETFEQQRL
jgi:hypothetical protein